MDDKRYANTRSIGGIDFIVSTSEEDHKFSTREAIVQEVPVGYDGPITIGDTLIVHHNVFKFYNDTKARRKSGRSFFKDDLFFIEPEQYFAYKNKDGVHAVDRYCFVKPIPPIDGILHKNISEEPLIGIMKYPNEYLKNQGISPGDKIGFSPESEYEFFIDGEKLYRMFDHQIVFKL